jgi:outer membrane protein OmpA-like peptidoglycan-associated protein
MIPMKKIFSLMVLFVTLSGVAFGQFKAANKKYDKMAYSAAAKKFERALARDSSNTEAWAKAASCYRLINDSKNAEKAYSKVAGSPTAKPEHYLYYAEALMENEKYNQATVWLDKFQSADPSDKRGENLKKGISQLSSMKAAENAFEVKKININSGYSDFSPVIFNGGILFTSCRPGIQLVGKSHSWTGDQFFRMYHAKGTDGSFSAPVLFDSKMQTAYHDGPVCFNATGSQIFMTRNNLENGKVREDEKDVTRLKIFQSNFENGKWGIDIPFMYNSDKYSCAHPALSADGKTLYFSSDMPGTVGGMDIWKCTWNGTAWDNPVNLGASINTKGSEIFPTVTKDGVLYFSSNGLPGFGGLDIYSIKANETNGSPLNAGSPINSPSDDFGITLGEDQKSGYFTSNRKLQGTNDDIYFFRKKCTNTNVLIVDEETGNPLKEADVKVFENGNEINAVTTDESGKFNMCLNPSNSYEFKAKKSDYSENKSSLSSAQIAAAANTGTEVKLPLKKKPAIVANVAGRVFNQDDKSPVTNQTVTLTNKTTGETKTIVTDNNGNYKFDNIPLNNTFEVSTTKKDCGDVKEPFNTNNIISSKTITMDMPLLCKGDIIKIENIYYDYNKFNIRPDAAVELDKVVALLNKYPTMTIELRSHTDARGKDEYNAKLSDNRAKSAVEYIISKGIAKSRLTAKGYGESELLNHCKNGVECDDKTHEQNRRTEFKILSM